MTKGIFLNYSKDNTGGDVDILLDGIEGNTIVTFVPKITDDWTKYTMGSLTLKDIEGVHDVTFMAKGGGDVFITMFQIYDPFLDSFYKAIHGFTKKPSCIEGRKQMSQGSS
jgi:hypothetical protein